MIPGAGTLPDDVAALRAALAAEQLARREAEARASGAEAIVAHLKLLIAKLRHEQFGASSERGRKLLDQLELQLEELEAGAAEDDTAIDPDPARRDAGPGRSRHKPVRGPLPAHLPRERVVIPGPTACPCCQGKLSKLGEDVTETLELVPRRWEVVQTVREKFVCRACETISQPPAPFHPIARGRAGPGLLATVLDAKFAQHLPLNRQSEVFAREGIELDTSTLADWIGAYTATLLPLVALIRAHVLAGGAAAWRRHHGPRAGQGQDHHRAIVGLRARRRAVRWTGPARGVVPLLARSPGRAPATAPRHLCGDPTSRRLRWMRRVLPSRAQAGPSHGGGLLSARKAQAVRPGQLAKAPPAAEVAWRIDAIFDVERTINGLPAEQRLAVQRDQVARLVADLEAWMRAARARMSRHADVARAMDYMLKRWDTFSRFLHDGRICLSNNAAERALRGVTLGRKAWLFVGSNRGGERAAAIYTLIVTAKLNGVDPRAWLADTLRRIAGHPASRLHELLPWNWDNTARQNVATA